MPLISVIIPVYNGEKTIKETIGSVLQQTFADFELIAIDDGSQDKTLEIISSIEDSRIKVFSYPNAGLGASRNRGISLAVGEYISFLDADDVWTPDKLEAQLKALEENPLAAVAYSWTDLIDESSQFLRIGGHVTVNGDAYAHLLLVNFLENGSNPLIRREALMEVGGFDESIPSAADWDLWIRLSARYPFVAVPSPQILYRVNSTSMSTNVFKQEIETIKAIEKAFSQAPESLQYLKKYSLANVYKYLAYKALEGSPKRDKGLIAAKFIWEAVGSDRTLFQKRVIWKVWLKILMVILLPRSLAEILLAKMNQVFNLHALLVHIQVKLPAKELS